MRSDREVHHVPVLVAEAVEALVHRPAGIYVDGTAGTGGHSAAIGEQLDDQGRLIAIDRDPDALRVAAARLTFMGDRVRVIKGNYADLDRILEGLGVREIHGALLDLGMSSPQLEHSGRGFSFLRDEPLDMRMDPEDQTAARDLVNELPQPELEAVLREYGEERRARSIAKRIVTARKRGPIESSAQLAELIRSGSPASRRKDSIHPATRTFQALRIAVNRELQNLRDFLEKIPSVMAAEGRLVILSYHSLEDRMVKQTFAQWEKGCTCPPDFPQCVCGKVPLFQRFFKGGVTPGAKEINDNPRARSAVMRAAVRV